MSIIRNGTVADVEKKAMQEYTFTFSMGSLELSIIGFMLSVVGFFLFGGELLEDEKGLINPHTFGQRFIRVMLGLSIAGFFVSCGSITNHKEKAKKAEVEKLGEEKNK